MVFLIFVLLRSAYEMAKRFKLYCHTPLVKGIMPVGKEKIIMNIKKYLAELLGTFVLTFVGCGTAVLICGSSAGGYVGTALAFGGAIVAMAYSVGNISGCHINPAVSLAMFLTKKMDLKDFLFYVLFQFIGGILAGLLLWLIFMHVDGCALGTNAVASVLGTDKNGAATAGALLRGLLVEVVLTFIFVLCILGVTSKKEYGSVAGLVIGGALTFVHLVGIGLTGTSVNPARSLGPALFALINGVTEPIQQIWIFILGPLAGAALAALVYNLVHRGEEKKTEEAPAQE